MCVVYVQQSLGKRQGTHWVGHQSISDQHRNTQDKQPCTHTLTPGTNLQWIINLTYTFLDCRSREHANLMQKNPRVAMQPKTFFLQGNSSLTVPLCIQGNSYFYSQNI
ncbi:hypothetical protein ATANTOWER_004711 [Ataeniobius toweri]|uniref:Uncharacterized protein n=1 Tax=Ataeniobius toweri TaxID=208326 RepID=A0ABU7B5L9_9TELE|nr:hypothetical protein [Ataeniobius toweri]